jgi:integrase
MFGIKPAKSPPRPTRKRIVGQKPPLKVSEIWAIRVRLQLVGKLRDLALFNLAIDSKLRACDLVTIRVRDVFPAGRATRRGIVMQQKTQRPVQFEITEHTRKAITIWVRFRQLREDDYLFPSRVRSSAHLSRRYARLLDQWIEDIGLDSRMYGTRSLRRTKASLIYRRTRNLRAVQLLLGHSKLESTVRYLGVEIDDALELAEQTEA